MPSAQLVRKLLLHDQVVHTGIVGTNMEVQPAILVTLLQLTDVVTVGVDRPDTQVRHIGLDGDLGIDTLNAGLKAIVCVGETLEQRELGYTETLLKYQTKMALTNVTAEQLKNVIVAYEPVWAIGTGVTATADQADEGNGFVRAAIAEAYGADVAETVTVQYGGSMNDKNAAELLSKENVDGGLIGGASLKSAAFAAIVEAAQ